MQARIASLRGARCLYEGARQAGDWAFINTLEVARKLESKGFTASQAQALADELYDLSALLGSRADERYMQRLEQEKNNEMHAANVSKEIERCKFEVEKLRTDKAHELEKVSSQARLEVNLEKGRIKDELQKYEGKMTNSEARLDKEIHNLRSHIG